MNGQWTHVPVLLTEAMEGLKINEDGTYLDGTFGRGGHAREILRRLGPTGRLLLMDRDPQAIATATGEFGGDVRVRIRRDNFAQLPHWPEVRAGVDGVLLDLGTSSPQLDDASRGFSFQADGPLDMRMDPDAGLSAAQFLVEADERTIADVLWRYGEEKLSRRIAKAIVEQRAIAPLTTTGELADLVARTLGYRERGKHPATRTFQALRIHVNGELDALEQGLDAALDALKPGGRLVVIAFHSLEDRIVKRFMRSRGSAPVVRRNLPPVEAKKLELVVIGKAQFAGDAELAVNPRARSAVLRIAEKAAVGEPA